MIEMVNGCLMTVEPSGAWNQCGERGAEGESLGRCGNHPYRALVHIFATGKRWVGLGAKAGKGGKEVAKGAGFSHLFRAFPGISHLFPHRFCYQVGLGTQFWKGRAIRDGLLRIVADSYALLRDVSRKFAQIRPVIPRCYALLRVRPFFSETGDF